MEALFEFECDWCGNLEGGGKIIGSEKLIDRIEEKLREIKYCAKCSNSDLELTFFKKTELKGNYDA